MIERMFDVPRSPYKAAEFNEARRLRAEEGMPMKQIAARLAVSPGTVHAWTRDISVDPEQSLRNRRRARMESAAKWVAQHRASRIAYQCDGRSRAQAREPLHVAGCMLYWAEGSKSRNTVQLSNSDPAMLRFFARFLVEAMGVCRTDFRIRINVYLDNGLTITEIEDHWLRVTGAPRSALRRHTLNHYPTSSSGRKRNLPHGVCSLGVCRSTWLVQHIYGAIQEYGGFEEPRWLDGDKPLEQNR